MKSFLVFLPALLILAAAPASALAASHHYLGSAVGGIAIHYNDNGDGESPLNIAYMRVQASETNTNGAVFNFDPNLAVSPGYGPLHIFQTVVDQFGLDLVYESPTTDGSVPTPVINAYDNVDGTLPNRALAGPVGWGISAYTGATNGPANPANGIINTLARGTTGELTLNDLTVSGTVFTVDIGGYLDTDGFIHWYNPGSGSSPFSEIPYAGEVATGRLYFQGSLSYDSALDVTPGIDFYAGTVDVFVEAVPEPSSLVLAGCGLLGLLALWRRRALRTPPLA